MKILKKILIGLAVFVVLLLVVSQLLPSTCHVERSVIILAKPDAIHPWVNDLKKWPEWTAWTTAKDATLVYSYEGAESGVGAISKWEGKKTGDGRLAITASDAQTGIKFDLSFDQGKYQSKGSLEYIFKSEAATDSTKVTWSFDSKVSRNPLDRYFSLLMDSFIGADFEEGLANLKRKAEAK